MVVWVYAGGGQAEFGLVPFFQRHFLGVTFERRTPQRQKPGPRPGVIVPYGATGKYFQQILEEQVAAYWVANVDVILVFDDLDCDDAAAKTKSLRSSVQRGLEKAAAERGVASIPKEIIVGFAVPEIESWIIADWRNTFEVRHNSCHTALKHTLSGEGVNFANVEAFDCRCGSPDTYRKISVVLQNAFNEACSRTIRYSKDTDTQALLTLADAAGIVRACPKFAAFWRTLQAAVEPAS